MKKFPPMEHYQERIYAGQASDMIYETIRIVGGENVARLHDADVARLFAAAPQMLEALQKAAELIHYLSQEHNACSDDILHDLILPAIEAAKGE